MILLFDNSVTLQPMSNKRMCPSFKVDDFIQFMHFLFNSATHGCPNDRYWTYNFCEFSVFGYKKI